MLMWGLLLVNGHALAAEWQAPLGRDHTLAGRIIYVPYAREVSRSSMLDSLGEAPDVIIGEKHDNPEHQRLEDWLIQKLVDDGVTVVFEMLDSSQAGVLAKLPQAGDLEDIRQRLNWPSRGWPWAQYGPLIQRALDQGGRLRAGNISREELQTLYKGGFRALAQPERMNTARLLRDDLSEPLSRQLDQAHCGKLPVSRQKSMLDIQLARDASMAYAMLTAKTPRRLLITGGQHARKDMGVPRHLDVFGRASRTLLLVEVQPGKTDWRDYLPVTGKVDYLWFTPRMTDRNYCDDIR
jgi:uncharacterized iron-regulated protein